MTILTPDAFQGDPLGWAGNQSAHVLIIGAGVWSLMSRLGLRRACAYGAVAASYALWEAVTFQGDILDAVTDFAFVAAGAGMAWAAITFDRRDLLLIFAGVIIAAGIGMVIRL